MKKIYLVLISCVLALNIMGCSLSNKQSSNADISIKQQAGKKDLTKKLESVNLSQLDEESIINVSSEFSFAYSCQSLDDIYDKSVYIVKGTVMNTYYTVIDGFSYTVVDLDVTDTIKGSIKDNTIITVLLSGGYMTLEQHISYYDDAERFAAISKEKMKSTYIETRLTDADFPKVKDEYVMALIDNDLCAGTYVPINEYETIFKKTGEQFVRTLPSDDYFGTEDNEKYVYLKDDKSFNYNWLKKNIKVIKSK